MCCSGVADRILIVPSVHHVLVWGCGLLGLAVVGLSVRSFWWCDEAARFTYVAAPWPSKGIDQRQIVGSREGGFFLIWWSADIMTEVDWNSGPQTEIIYESTPTSV